MSESPFSAASTWDLVAPGYAVGSVDHFEAYANAALDLAQVNSGQRVVDVATGPGSLALLAAKRGARVDALDYSAQMLEQLAIRAKELGIDGVSAEQGDGQHLPFDDGLYDAGFSMFGLMFFPDRVAGYSELYRVLQPGGRCVVSSWQPMDSIVEFESLFEGLAKAIPDMPQEEEPGMPLSKEADVKNEMAAAGFDVEVHSFSHAMTADSMSEFWQGIRKSYALVVLMENDMGTEAFEPISTIVEEHLIAKHGNGPVSMKMSAWLGLGRKLA